MRLKYRPSTYTFVFFAFCVGLIKELHQLLIFEEPPIYKEVFLMHNAKNTVIKKSPLTALNQSTKQSVSCAFK